MREAADVSLQGKRAFVTGGSKGIGAVIAQTLAMAGADVAIVGRDQEGLLQTQKDVVATGRECLIITADLATVEGAHTAGEAALAHAERWDILVNNAGRFTIAPLLKITPEEWDNTQAVNLRSVLLLSQVLVPQMLERRSGKIINISSVGAFLGTPGFGAYTVSKGGLNQLTRSMAVEWGPYNVQANAVCPTVILTESNRKFWSDPTWAEQMKAKSDRIPMHRFGEPQEVANLVLFLASPTSNFINGVTIPVDGGLLAAP